MMLKRGSQLVSAWVKSPCSYVVEALARKGSFNAVTLDLQHGMTDLAAAATNLRIIAASGVAPVVRLTSQDPGHIGRCLDFGASAVICPMINTVEQARGLVAATRYPPLGQRSWGPLLACLHDTEEYFDRSNDEVTVLAMVETREAILNLDQILKVDGLDGIFVGPSDLAISMGKRPVGDPTDQEVLDTLASVAKAAGNANKMAGIFCANGAMAAKMFAQGYDFCAISNDIDFMLASATSHVAAARRGGNGGSGNGGGCANSVGISNGNADAASVKTETHAAHAAHARVDAAPTAPLSAEASAAAAAAAAASIGASDDGTVWVWADGTTSATTAKPAASPAAPPPPSAAETAAALNAAAAVAAAAHATSNDQADAAAGTAAIDQHHAPRQHREHHEHDGSEKPDWVQEYESFVEKNSFGGMQDNLSAAAIGGEEGWKEATKDWASALDDFDEELANLYNETSPMHQPKPTAGTGTPTSGAAAASRRV